MWEYIMTLCFCFLAKPLRSVFLSRVKLQKRLEKRSKGQGLSEHSALELFHRTHVRSATLVPVGDLGRCTLIHRLHR